MAAILLKVIRTALSTLAVVSPEAAGRLGLKLFIRTPGPNVTTVKEKAALAAAAPKMRTAETIMLNFACGSVAAHRFAPDGPVENPPRVLIVHGWGSRADYLVALIAFLTAAGAEVVALDLPGHGASPGRTLTMPMAIRAIDAAWRQFGSFNACIGHSFGGGALAASAGGVLPDVRARVPGKLVVIGAPSEMTWLFTDFGKLMRFGPKAQRSLEDAIERLAGAPLSDFDVAKAAGRLACPVLVVHAEDDKEVSSAHALRYAAAGKGVSLFWANGFGHRRIVSAAPVLARIAAFVFDKDNALAA
ncbi:alpha/beta hydrolase [Pararhizobium sp.]|uniref:alpha/beta hydrolase n=1 Tax=Pararhizobium sp. TaxID=1977563 RepID=UPI002716881A|nr:alpha/beta fold hydrolase [Pararhizobium sp.]MDO9418960.1 alpha/beta fold hydrolase [Pararhizobium sp.]